MWRPQSNELFNRFMSTTKHSPVTLSRRHVLGDLYARCDALTGHVPVYLDGGEGEPLGHANEESGTFADAISFFLDDENCKKLSSGYFTFALNCNLLKAADKNIRERVVVESITLVGRKNYDKPIARRR